MTEEIEKQIVDELRNQTALQKRINVTALIILGIFLFVFLPFHGQIISRFKSAPQTIDSWREARSLNDNGDHQKSMEMIQRLIKKHPDYYYGYYLLGSLNQEIGNLNEAEANYAKAYDLFPTEDNEKDLAAIRKAIEKKTKTANRLAGTDP